MIVFDDALGISEDGLFAVHKGIRRQSTLGYAEGHRAACGMEAESHLVRGSNFVVQASAVWEKIQVVGGSGASRQSEFGERRLRGSEDVFGAQARPEGIERGQPGEEIGVLGGRDGARQGLVEVMVRVDEAWQDDVIGEVEHDIGRGGQCTRRADLLNEAITNKQTTIADLPLVIIHGHNIGVLNQQRRHGDTFSRVFGVGHGAAGSSATRWSQGRRRFRADREVMIDLGTQGIMRVDVPGAADKAAHLSLVVRVAMRSLRHASLMTMGAVGLCQCWCEQQ